MDKPFEFPPRECIAHLPTPISLLSRLSAEMNGPAIYIKRDDLTGCAMSGNKLRKLEFVAADALAKQADVLITCGGIQSNHARTTAVLAAQLGLKAHLVLRGQEGGDADGNLFLDKLVDADITTITREQYSTQVNEIMGQIAADLRAKGRTPYVIPEGASNAIGVFGYLRAIEEIRSQEQQLGLTFDAIVCAVGSGGTYAGLLLGRNLFGLFAEIIGFNVCDDAAYFVKKIQAIVQDVIAQYGYPAPAQPSEIRIVDGYVGKGYALSRQEEIDLIKHVARLEGIILDPVYTAKAMFGLIDQIKRGQFHQARNVLFLHTGGIFGLFPKKSLFF